ncbi:MAG: cytochrome b N-terminal domain-containing protein [Thermoanaerobaculia bacterium]
MRLLQKMTDFLEDRLELPTLWRGFTDRNLPRGIGWLQTLGSATLFLLLVQTATGILLAFYYVPSPEHAFHSVSLIETQLPLGWLIRGIHKWAASLVVLLVVLHLLRVLYMGAFKYPRELTWVVGVLLLLVVLAFGFTGYLLPWDQRGYWATVVGTHIASFAPALGPYVMETLRGQPDVGVRTLGRFYAFHTLFLPALLFLLVAVHVAMVVKQGIAPWPAKKFASVRREEYWKLYQHFKEGGRPFYVSMAKDAVVALGLLLLVFFLAWKLGAPIGEEADPTSATFVPRPEWYFLFLFELLWWFPGQWIPVATFWIPAFLILLLLFLPWLDRSIHRSPLRRPLTTGLTSAFVLAAIFLTYKGASAPTPPAAATAVRARLEQQALSPLAQKGRGVYEEQGCAACHSIAGAGSAAGPDLTKIARRRDADWLARFITAPEKVTPGAEMPAYDGLTKEELNSLVAYLQTLR